MVFLSIPLHDGLCWCVILQAMDPEVLREMERALKENKTLEKLRLSDVGDRAIPKEFCHHVLLATRQSTSLLDVHLTFRPPNWDCQDDGRLVCQSRIV